jgi:fatty acid desaturase
MRPLTEAEMARTSELQVWAGRLCLGSVFTLGAMGFHYGNIRFLPVALGCAILAALCYGLIGRSSVETSKSRLDSGSHPSL